MKTDLSHLPEHKQAELKGIVACLVPKYAEVEMIILYGSYARGNWVEDKYVENGTTYEYKSDYDLLIITSTNGKANADSFLQAVTQRLDDLKLNTPVHPSFHGIEFVNEALREVITFLATLNAKELCCSIPAVSNWQINATWCLRNFKQKHKKILINGLQVQMFSTSSITTLIMMAI